jgi:hypothetical protein
LARRRFGACQQFQTVLRFESRLSKFPSTRSNGIWNEINRSDNYCFQRAEKPFVDIDNKRSVRSVSRIRAAGDSQMTKRLLLGFGLLALPLGVFGATSLAQNSSVDGPKSYVCAPGQGSVHLVSDLKGGDLRDHQTAGNPAYTCYSAYKPSGSNGNWSCAEGGLHLVSDLKGGVEPRHQAGDPPHTCIQGNLPECAPGFVTTAGLGIPLTPNGVCIPRLQ